MGVDDNTIVIYTTDNGNELMLWPDGGYAPTWHVLSELVGELSEPEQEAILGGTASRVYGIC